MKRAIRSFAVLMMSMLTILACNHATNEQDPPSSSEFAIVQPAPQSLVEGTVNITVNLKSIVPTAIEFYVDGELIGTSTASPWHVAWDVSGLPSQSYHTLRARAYNANRAYKTTTDVVVKIKIVSSLRRIATNAPAHRSVFSLWRHQRHVRAHKNVTLTNAHRIVIISLHS